MQRGVEVGHAAASARSLVSRSAAASALKSRTSCSRTSSCTSAIECASAQRWNGSPFSPRVACPHCHGWELRGEPLAPIRPARNTGPHRRACAAAEPVSQDVVLLTRGEELDDDQVTHLRRTSVAAETRERVGVA